MFNFFNKKIRENTTRGFTLVEMTIVGAIFGILTTIVVFKYGDFTSNMLVTNMAYEIALTTRQAQAFSVGVRGYEFDGARTFENPYGVYFSLNEEGANGRESRSFIFFVDRDDNKICSSGLGDTTSCSCAQGDECLEQLNLQRNIRITEIKVGDNQCGSIIGISNEVTAVSVTFKRPSPEAKIVQQDRPDRFYSMLQIKVEAPNSGINPSYILIRENGQISVSSNNSCPDVV